MKKLLLSVLAAASLLTAANSVEAHTKCKRYINPWGGWTEACPHLHKNRPPTFHPAPRPRPRPSNPKGTYYWKIKNVDSKDTISYKWGNSKYYLRPGQSRSHTSSYQNVYLRFDKYAGDGVYTNYNWRFNANHYDLKVWRNGTRIQIREVPD